MSEESFGSAQRVSGTLRRLGIASQVRTMPQSTRSAAEAAAALGCDVAEIVKSLVFRAVEGDTPLLVLASGADRVDEARLAEVVGGPVEKATGRFVRDRTGFAIGGVPPLGHAETLPTYLDEHLLAYPTVWAAAGTPRTLFPISPEDLVRATSASVVAVTPKPGK